VKKFQDMFIHFDTIHECDKRTDGQTLHDGIGCTKDNMKLCLPNSTLASSKRMSGNRRDCLTALRSGERLEDVNTLRLTCMELILIVPK